MFLVSLSYHESLLLFLQHMTMTFKLVTGEFSCFPSVKCGITYTVSMTKEPFPNITQSLNYICTHTYRYPPDHSGQTQHIYLWIGKKKSEILIVQKEQMKQFTHSRQQHLTVAASGGQACDSCGSEGNNREDNWKTQHFLSKMRPISQRMAGYICKWGQLVPDLNPCPIWFCKIILLFPLCPLHLFHSVLFHSHNEASVGVDALIV